MSLQCIVYKLFIFFIKDELKHENTDFSIDDGNAFGGIGCM